MKIKGNFEKYNFLIRENLIMGLECWQTISVVLVEYKGTYYFSYLNENVFYNDTEDSLWWNDLS